MTKSLAVNHVPAVDHVCPGGSTESYIAAETASKGLGWTSWIVRGGSDVPVHHWMAWVVLARPGEEGMVKERSGTTRLVPVVGLADLTGLETSDGCCLSKRAASREA
jgi:hypothetical protein